MISSGIFLSAAFILLRLFTNNKPNMTAINKMHRSRRATVTPAATGAATVIVVGTVAQRKYSGALALCDYFINVSFGIIV